MPQPKDQVFWYTKKEPAIRLLDSDLTTEAVVIGGGMTGLTAAQHLRGAGLEVVLLEKDFCGSGASGKSSGFITPDSELELSDIVKNYGDIQGKSLWEFARQGVEIIRQNILEFGLDCDYQIQDSLFIANFGNDFKQIKEEHKVQQRLGYQSILYDSKAIKNIVGSQKYSGGVRFKDTFGLNSYLYCQGMRSVLERMGVGIYEKSPVRKISPDGVEIDGYKIKAKYIIACGDRFLPDINVVPDTIYNAQTFLSISKTLTNGQVKTIFPENKLMVWDTDLIYQYYRITGDNRLLLGGADIIYTYYPKEHHNSKLISKKLYAYLREKFPGLDVEFEYLWPGLIGVSKDFVPIAGQSKKQPNFYFAGAGAGLPWSASLGSYICDKITKGRSDFNKVFSPERRFPIGRKAQKLISKPLSFAISHGIKKYLNK